jgi:putative ABC transport system permease protein
MSFLPAIVERLKGLFSRSRTEAELDEELRFHLALEEEARARAGSADPRREALLAFGGVGRVKEEVREARGNLRLEEFAADVHYAGRALGRNAGFAFSVILVLGLAIGAAAAVFELANKVVLSALPYPDADQLVRIYQQNSPSNIWSLSAVDLQAIAADAEVFEAFGAARSTSATLSGVGAPERVEVGRVTPGFFRVLGTRAAEGRLLVPRDTNPAAPATVVVSHRLAQRSFGGARAALGRTVTLDGVPHLIVGVLGPDQQELAGLRADLWPVLRLGTPTRRGPFGYRGYARLKPGVTIADAGADLARVSQLVFPTWKASFQDSAARLTPVPLRRAVIGGADRPVGLFAGAVVLVLLLATANVATLTLVRASSRDHEFAVRIALGASRGRLVRLILTESAILALGAGCVALLVARLGIVLTLQVAPNLPRLDGLRFDAAGMLFAGVAAACAGLVISIAPIVTTLVGRRASVPGLAGSPARSGAGRRAGALRASLVVSEFALALPLLLAAGFLLASFLNVKRVPLGFDPDGLVALRVALPSGLQPDSATVFWRSLASRAAEVRGVDAAGLSSYIPPDNQGDVNNFDLLDRPVAPGASQPVSPWSAVSNDYFGTMGIPLIEGRLFTLADSAAAPPVAVVSSSWANRYYPGESPLGRQMYSGGCTTCPPVTVVGIVGDVHYLGLTAAEDAVYAPIDQDQPRSLFLVARGRGSPGATLEGLRAAVSSLDPNLAPAEFIMRDHLQDALGDPRRWFAVVGGFAAAGVLLAALGIFGLMAYVVRQRQRELGVRLALGATPGTVAGLVVRRGLWLAAIGAGIGLILFAAASHILAALLFGVRPGDPATIVAGTVSLLAFAGLACWIPGMRAARIRPIEALGAD